NSQPCAAAAAPPFSRRSRISLPRSPMGVRARVAEWPPKNPQENSQKSSSKPFPRRPLQHSKDVEFQEFPGIALRHRSSSEVTLSECDGEETSENRGNAGGAAGLFREYGSTSSIDVQGIPEQSFFEMLNEFRAKKPELPTEPKEKPRRRCPRNDDSIFKKLRNPRHDGDARDADEPRIPDLAKSWICRKGFAHFDVQSIFFEAVSFGAGAAQRRNTTTGASAASAGSDPNFSSTEDLNSKENLEQDLGDDTSNELLLSCPHFRNEIGGGAGERDVSFAKSAAPAPNLPERSHAGKPSNAGVNVLELCRRHKVGILYCKAGQSSEEEMYNNEAAGPALDEFLTLLGEKVSLKSFTKYAAQLDTKSSWNLGDPKSSKIPRLVTLRGSILEDAVPSTSKAGSVRGIPLREILEFVVPELNIHCLRLALATPKVTEQLLKLDEQGGWNLLGEKVSLKSFTKYAAQLDTKTDSTGTHSLYTTYQDYEIMFHVSTMLPYTPNNRQQVRPEPPRAVAVTRSKDVPPFGPPVPPSGVTFRRSDLFRAFLLAKAINAENAAHKSHKFRTMATRTRQEYLRDLAENYVTNTPLDTAGKFNLISLASKKKEKSKARPLAELESAGAVSWRVSALDFGRGGAEIPCALGISKELLVLVDLAAKEVVFNCFTGDVIGWSAEGAALRIYHGRGDLVSVRAGAGSGSGSGSGSGAEGAEGAAEEIKEIVQRLKAGLRRGSRLLEVCKVAAVALSHEQMIDLLRTSVTVTVGIVPPHEDGTPR
ncbi:Signal-induced proliferation-associated 1-like protein 3, partial [Lamprotornis superbus]